MSDSSVLDQPLEVAAAWHGPQLRDDGSWLHHLTSTDVEELETALAAVRRKGRGVLEIGREDFPLPTLGPVIERWVEELDQGRGFVWVRGLPVERYTEEEASIILHSRTEYEDFDEPGRKRHLLRLWLTLHRNAADGQGRGGIPATGATSS